MTMRVALCLGGILLLLCVLAGAQEATPTSQPSSQRPEDGFTRLRDRRKEAQEAAARREWRAWSRRIVRRYAEAESAPAREDIVTELYEVTDPNGLDAMTRLFDCDHFDLRRAALTVTSMRDFTSDELPGKLIDVLLKDSSDDLRHIAASALERVRTEREIHTLLRVLRTSDRRAAGWAAIALGRLRDYRAVEPLIKQLNVRIVIPAPGNEPSGPKPVWTMNYAPGTMAYDYVTISVVGGKLRILPIPNYKEIHKKRREKREERKREKQGTRALAGNIDARDALIEITSRDFGFDQKAWTAWWSQYGGELLAEQRRTRGDQEPQSDE